MQRERGGIRGCIVAVCISVGECTSSCCLSPLLPVDQAPHVPTSHTPVTTTAEQQCRHGTCNQPVTASSRTCTCTCMLPFTSLLLFCFSLCVSLVGAAGHSSAERFHRSSQLPKHTLSARAHQCDRPLSLLLSSSLCLLPALPSRCIAACCFIRPLSAPLQISAATAARLDVTSPHCTHN